MSYAGERAACLDGQPLSEFEYAQRLAAALACLLIGQQDAVGLVTFDSKVRRYIPARSRASQVSAILRELHETRPGGETGLGAIFHDIAERVHRRGMIVVISDLFDDAEEVVKALHHFRYCRHDVVVLHVMAEEELTFPFKGFTHFRDLEGAGRRVQVDPKTIRARYLDRVREFVDRIEKGCGQIRSDYVPMSTRDPFEKALANFLGRRRRAR
jgi:uncharacterized protein (DUF58 family)